MLLTGKSLDRAIKTHLMKDTINGGLEIPVQGKPLSPSLQQIVGSSVFARPLFVSKINGDFDATDDVPQITYYNKEGLSPNKCMRESMCVIYIRDKNQVRIEDIAERVVNILTLPYQTKPAFKYIEDDDVKIKLIRLSDVDDTLPEPKSFLKRIKFEIKYIKT